MEPSEVVELVIETTRAPDGDVLLTVSARSTWRPSRRSRTLFTAQWRTLTEPCRSISAKSHSWTQRGLRALVMNETYDHGKPRVVVVNPSVAVRRLLTVTGLAEILLSQQN